MGIIIIFVPSTEPRIIMKKPQNSLVIAIIVSMLIWGLSWPSAKILSGHISYANFGAYRYVLALLTLFPTLLFLKAPLKIKKKGIPVAILSGVLLALYNLFFFKGLRMGFAGAGGVLVTILNPIMAYGIGLLVSRKRPSRNEFIGLTLGLTAGCVLLKIWNNADTLFASGNLYFLAAAFTWAVMSKFTSVAFRYGYSISFSLWQYLVTMCCFLPMLNVKELQTTIATADIVFWINLFFSAAIVTSGATTLYFYATAKLGAEKASSFIFIVPFAAAVSSWLLLSESILIHTAIGGVIGILAVYMINKKRREII